MANSATGWKIRFNSYLCANATNTQMSKEITDTTIRICKKARDVRNHLGMSQGELAREAGLHREAVTRLERGAISPTVDMLARTLEPLGYTVDIVPIEAIED